MCRVKRGDKSGPRGMLRLVRPFLVISLVTGYLFDGLQTAAAPVPAGTTADPRFSAPVIDPKAIPQFVTDLPVPGPNWGVVDLQAGGGATIQVSELPLQVLPAGFPPTPVWAYRQQGTNYTGTFLGPTIIARTGIPVDITYDYATVPHPQGNATPHILRQGLNPTLSVVDKAVHGTDAGEPEARFIAHLHGGKNVADTSDGYSEAWVTPTGTTDPASPIPNQATLHYPNDQDGTLGWYHDHALGITRLNVYAGLAAGYIIRGTEEQPGGRLAALSGLPEIPLVIQDRMFYPDGRLAYPDLPWVAPANAGPVTPWLGGPSTLPEFFGDVMLVNGVTWPRIPVPAGQVRLRLINGCDSRFLLLHLSRNGQAQNGPPFTILGVEGGFLNNAVISPTLLMGNAERFDVIVDFTGQAGKTFTLINKGARKPFPGGKLPHPQLDGVVAQFVVGTTPPPPSVTLPGQLRDTPVPPLPNPLPPNPIRVLLTEGQDEFGRIQSLLGTVTLAAAPPAGPVYTGTSQRWFGAVTENPALNQTVVWEIFNTTVDSHPVHLHAVLFQVVNRQGISFNKLAPTPGAAVQVSNIQLAGAALPPQPWETGAFKDTVIAYPGQVTRIVATFDIAGLFQWHCHILEHEDHEMMRPYRIGP